MTNSAGMPSDEDIGVVAKLAEMVDRSTVNYLDLEIGGWRLFLSKTADSAAPRSAARAIEEVVETAPSTTWSVTAPSVGIFNKGGVQAGTVVEEGTLLGHVAALDDERPVRAAAGGLIVEMHVEDQQFVEYGQSLFLVQAA